MSKLWKRLSSEEFQFIFDQGYFVSGKLMSICVLTNQTTPLVGFAMKKAKRTSVERNYLKRKLREAFLMVQFFLSDSWHIVLIGTDSVLSTSIEQISEEIIYLTDIIKRKYLESSVQSAYL